MSQPLTLVSHHLCPYVQRAAISLHEKQVPFARRYVDLADKPGWFKELSPLGKVPLLLSGTHAIFESAVILEYLEETQPHPLHPAEPERRAVHRAWIEFGSSILNDIAGFYGAREHDVFEVRRGGLREKFSRLEHQLVGSPWFDGADFSLVDAVFGPIFRYFDTFDRIADFKVFDGLPKIRRWRSALVERPSITAAAAPDYPQRLEAFLRARNTHLSTMMP